MRILLTGSEGKIGKAVVAYLAGTGHNVIGFDLTTGDDVRVLRDVENKAGGCEAICHLAAVIDENVPDLMASNVLGTWNVLEAAQRNGVSRVVFMSSVNAIGVFLGHREPDYLPIDDRHPSYAYRPYAISKRFGELMCEARTALARMTTVCLRPPAVLVAADYESLRRRRVANPSSEWQPFWEYGAFLDVRDCATAIERALLTDLEGHHTVLLCADDISATQPALAMVRQLLPQVAWRGGPDYEREPFKALLDTRRAKELLQWEPRYRWRT